MSVLVVLGLGFCGCSQGLGNSVARKIAGNRSLTKSERKYAVRYYRHCVVEAGYVDELGQRMEEIGFEAPYTVQLARYPKGMYEKWGLGSGKVSLEEKAYVDKLRHMVTNWESYQRKLKAIDLKNLTSEQEQFLSSLHQKCGEGPINMRNCWSQESKLTSEHEVYLRVYKAITGHEELLDMEILALR